MQDLPHHYRTTAKAAREGTVTLAAPGLEDLVSAPPAEFGGPGDKWSPETLLTAALVDCFILTFRAIARASKLEWVNLTCEVVGTLDRVEKITKFVRYDLKANLQVSAGTDVERAKRLLERAETTCLITNSLSGESHLETEVTFV
ncbi:MAG: OsmC family peroxiredoxin [Myxococcales bacterium]|nr:OsmC family peroxiredoxin [Myxococcales bacterium]